MQVRSSRRPSVARQPDALAALDRKAGFGRGEVEGERFAGVLQLVDVGFDRLGEALQVAVYRHPSVGVSDVKRLAESARRDVDARDVAVVHGEDGLADHALRLDVDPRVEMASAQFAVVGRQPQRNIQRRSVAGRLSAWRRRLSRNGGRLDSARFVRHACGRSGRAFGKIARFLLLGPRFRARPYRPLRRKRFVRTARGDPCRAESDSRR